MDAGKILDVISTDAGSVKDIEAFCNQTGNWTRAIKRFALFDLLKSLYSDTNILSKYIPSLPKKL
jgi:TusA-related sulfurtransferase